MMRRAAPLQLDSWVDNYHEILRLLKYHHINIKIKNYETRDSKGKI